MKALLVPLLLTASLAQAAPLVVQVAADLECPYTRNALKETVPKLEKEHAGKVRFEVRAFPLAFHPNARRAARASLCAREQNYESTFVNTLLEFTSVDKTGIAEASQKLEMLHGAKGEPLPGVGAFSLAKFENCLGDSQMESRLNDEIAESAKRGVLGTPAFIFPSETVAGNRPEEIARAVVAALAKFPQETKLRAGKY